LPEIEFFFIFNPLELFFGSCAKDSLIIGGILPFGQNSS